MRYEMLTSGNIWSEDNYIFSNTNIADTEYLSPLEEGDAKEPGIKITVERCTNLKKFYSGFEYLVCDKENPSFQGHYEQVLHDESNAWKIGAVKIGHRFLYMDFFNEELYHAYYAGVMDEDNVHDEKMPYYHESVIYQFPSDEKEHFSVKLRFAIEHSDNSAPEVILVSFSNSGPTTITEIGDNKRREIYLPGVQLQNFDGSKHNLISVVEHYR